MVVNRLCYLAVAAIFCLSTGTGFGSEVSPASSTSEAKIPLAREILSAAHQLVELRTPYKVVSQDVADTVLHGTIRRVEQTLLSRGDDGGLPQELELRVLLDMEWLDARTGQPLRSCEGFEVVGHYIPSRPIGQPLDEAVHSVAQRAADRAVMMMRDAW